jgi:hypothetical protein
VRLSCLGLQLALDHHLRGDAGVVGADHPQRILAAQPLVADHHVLQRVVERVADVQAAGDVGRRVDDGERLRHPGARAEQAVGFPVGIPLRLDPAGSKVLSSSELGVLSVITRGLCQPRGGGASGQSALQRPQFSPTPAAMREWAEFSIAEGEGGARGVVLSGPLVVASIGRLDTQLRGIEGPFTHIDLSDVGEIDTVGAWTVWRFARDSGADIVGASDKARRLIAAVTAASWRKQPRPRLRRFLLRALPRALAVS